MLQLWEKVPSWLRNKYTITLLVFVTWMLFFDQNDLMTQMSMRMELRELQDNKAYYETEIARTRDELEELLTNEEKLERFAREKYLMKKDDEVVFVIVPEED